MRRIPWTDRALVRLACWCRAHMTTATAYYFDLEAYERMAVVQRKATEVTQDDPPTQVAGGFLVTWDCQPIAADRD